jgi:arylsulfatase A-like enzyme
MDKKPNVILITVDSLRADRLRKEINPNIDALASQGAVFSNALAVGPHSPYSFPVIFTSTYPLDYHGPMVIDRPRVFLSEVLKSNGYATALFHSTVRLSGFFGYDRGWDYFKNLENPSYRGFKKKGGKVNKKIKTVLRGYSFRAGLFWANIFPSSFFFLRYLAYRLTKKMKNPNVPASSLNEAAKDFIKLNKDAPIFLHMHYMDVHGPFFPYDYYTKGKTLSYSEFKAKSIAAFSFSDSSPLLKRFIKKNIKKTFELYDDGIKYLDGEVGDFFNFLKQENIWDNSVVIFTADHGEEMWDHGEPAHGKSLYNELLKVPLIVRVPDKKPEIIDKKVSLLALAPTICDLAKVKRDPSFKGGNLFKNVRKIFFHQTAYNENKKVFRDVDIDSETQCFFACQTDKYKYIMKGDFKAEELYDLENDPKEKNNIAGEEKEVLLEMREAIQEFKKKNPVLSIDKN